MNRKLRLFYALWPDKETCTALTELQSVVSGKKVPPENLHITLAFLGEQSMEVIPVLKQILKTLPPFSLKLSLDKTSCFRSKRISWAGMTETPESLIQLHTTLRQALSEKQISFDKRNRFKPHITLARQSDHLELAEFVPISWQARHLVLAESRFPGQQGKRTSEYVFVAERFFNE